jgi:hypothetical protein
VADARLRELERALAAASAAVKAATVERSTDMPTNEGAWERKVDALSAALEEQGQCLRRLNQERRRAGLPVIQRRCRPNKTARRNMTKAEVRMASALGACRFTPGSFDKGFARSLAEQARATAKISARQAELLPQLVQRYRRQIPAEVVLLALEHSAPDGTHEALRLPGEKPLADEGPLFRDAP